MKNHIPNVQMKKVRVGLLSVVLVPGAAFACACGCGVFDVGTSLLMPERAGGMASLNYDYQNQNQNWRSKCSLDREGWLYWRIFFLSNKALVQKITNFLRSI